MKSSCRLKTMPRFGVRYGIRFSTICMVCMMLCLTTANAFAIDRTWNNAAGGDFNTATNWTPNGVPGTSDNALITLAGSYAVTMSDPATIGGLTVGASSGAQTLDLSSQTLTISGAATIDTSGTLSIDNGILTTNGVLTVNGKLLQDQGRIQGSGAQTIASGGTFDWSGGTLRGSALSETTTIESGGILNLLGQVVLDKRTLTNNGVINVDNTDGEFFIDNGAVINNETGGLIDLSSANDYQFTHYNGTGARLTLNNKVGAIIRKRVGTGNVDFDDVNLSNAGRVEVQSGTLTLRSFSGGAAGTSSGTFDVSAGALMQFAQTPHTFQGTTFTGAGISSITGDTISVGTTATLANGATLEVSSGTLTVNSGATLSVPSGANLFIRDSFTSLLTVASGGKLDVASGGIFTINDGTLNGAGTIDIKGTLNWAGGKITGAALSETTTISTTGILNLLGQVVLDKRTLTNNGVINVDNTVGEFFVNNGAIINNETGGLIDLSSANDYEFTHYDGTGARLTLNNKIGAIIRKRDGTGNVDFDDVNLSNAGRIEVQSGTLTLRSFSGGASGTSSGTFDVAAGAAMQFAQTPHAFQGTTLSGAGLHSITGDFVTVGTTATVTNGATLEISSGTLTVANAGTLNIPSGANLFIRDSFTSLLTVATGGKLNVASGGILNIDDGTLNGAGTIDIKGTMNWSGGKMTGASLTESTTIASGGILNLLGQVVLDKRALTNTGVINVDNTDGEFFINNGAVINNETGGLIDLSSSGDYEFTHYDGTGSRLALNNKAGAIIRKRVGAGNVNFDDVNLSNVGRVEVQSGTLTLRSFSGGASGTSSGTFDVSAGAVMQFAQTPHAFQGTTLSGAGLLSITGDFVTVGTTATVTNGATLEISSGTLTVANGGTLNIPSGANLFIRDSFTSLLTVASGGKLDVASGGIFTINDGTLNGAGTIDIKGILNWRGGKMTGAALNETTTISTTGILNLLGQVVLDKRTLANNGVINVDNTNGEFFVNNGAVINNETGGLIDLSSANNYEFTHYDGTGARLSLNNKVGATVRKRVGTGNVNFDDVIFSNSGIVEVQSGTLTLRSFSGGGSFSNFAGTTLTGGTYLLTGVFKFPGANVVTNAADVTLISSGSAIVDQNDDDALANFATNASAGKFTLQGGRILNISSNGVSNAGTFTIGSNSKLDILGASQNYTQSAGATVLQGGTLATSATGQVNINGGTLSGNGNIASTLINGGTVSPGFSAGIINVTRNYTQSATFKAELGGTDAATPDYDQLKPTGTVTLDGTLSLSLIDGFTPADGDTFTLISNGGSDAVVGTFNGLPQGSTLAVGNRLFKINYAGGDGNDVVLGFVVPKLSINDVSIVEGDSGTKTLSFTATLSLSSPQIVTVDYATADGTATQPADYTTTSGTLSFPVGTLTKTFTVPIAGDTLTETNETLKVNLSNVTGGAAIADAQGIGTIIDTDAPPTLSINDVTVAEGDSSTLNATFQVKLSAASTKVVTVNAIPSNGTAKAPGDYTAGGFKLTFQPGDTVKTVTVPVVGDTINEVTESFFVVLGSPVNAGIVKGRGTCTITDSDPVPAISVSDISVQEGNFGTRVAAFTLKLSAPSGQIVRVNYTTANGTATAGPASSGGDYVAAPLTQIAFATGRTAVLVRVVINSDTADEPNETFNLNLSSPVAATISDAQSVATINDDDPLPSLSIGNASIVEGNSGSKTLNFTVTLTGKTARAVSVSYATSNGTATAGQDYVAKTGTLNFPVGTTVQTVSVTINGDTTVEVNETFFALLSAPTNAAIGVGRGAGTINNDDASQSPNPSPASPSSGDTEDSS